MMMHSGQCGSWTAGVGLGPLGTLDECGSVTTFSQYKGIVCEFSPSRQEKNATVTMGEVVTSSKVEFWMMNVTTEQYAFDWLSGECKAIRRALLRNTIIQEEANTTLHRTHRWTELCGCVVGCHSRTNNSQRSPCWCASGRSNSAPQRTTRCHSRDIRAGISSRQVDPDGGGGSVMVTYSACQICCRFHSTDQRKTYHCGQWWQQAACYIVLYDADQTDLVLLWANSGPRVKVSKKYNLSCLSHSTLHTSVCDTP